MYVYGYIRVGQYNFLLASYKMHEKTEICLKTTKF